MNFQSTVVTGSKKKVVVGERWLYDVFMTKEMKLFESFQATQSIAEDVTLKFLAESN